MEDKKKIQWERKLSKKSLNSFQSWHAKDSRNSLSNQHLMKDRYLASHDSEKPNLQYPLLIKIYNL